jgi:hypothetical protein
MRTLPAIWPLVALVALAAAFTTGPSNCSAQTIIGPGAVAPIELAPGSYRFRNGTEIQATSSLVGDTLTGGPAVLANSTEPDYASPVTAVFEGGVYQGGSVTTQTGVPRAVGGNAVQVTGVGYKRIEILGGEYRGGSVLVDAPAEAAAGAALAITDGNGLLGTTIIIRGGVFTGGTVSPAASPNDPLSRAAAMSLVDPIGSGRGGRLTVHGGQFIGGIDLGGAQQMWLFGTNMTIQPPPVDVPGPSDVIPPNTEVVIAGTYRNGSQFSHAVRSGPLGLKATFIGPLSGGPGPPQSLLLHVPEPAAGALAAVACALAASLRRRTR